MAKRKRRTLRRRSVDSTIEKLLVTGLIMSREFMLEIYDQVDPRLFKMEFAGIVAQWCKDHYREYSIVPKEKIEEIFEVKKEQGLLPATATIIETFLSGLSEVYESQDQINVEYLIDEGRIYFANRAIDVLAEDITRLSRAGKHDRAQKLIKVFVNDGMTINSTDRLEDSLTNEMINLHGPEEDENDYLFWHNEGRSALGQLYGKLKCGYLAGILAPMKRGKTWFLDNFAIDAVYQGLTVYKFSLEMPQTQQVSRLFQSITGFTDDGKKVVLPCFDCWHNQDGSCRKDERTSDVKLIIGYDEETSKPLYPEFKPRMRYKTCTACRSNGTDDYLPSTWFFAENTKSKTITKMRKTVKQFKAHGSGGRIYTKAFKFDGTISNIKGDIEYAIANGAKRPHIIIVDYADIIQVDRSEIFGNNDRATFDYVWKSLKRMAMEYDCIVLTATQGNRKSFLQDSLNETNVSEDVRKLAHCDVMWALNQKPEEYKHGIIRVSTLLHRHARKSTDTQVVVLQALDIGATELDSEWMFEGDNLF